MLSLKQDEWRPNLRIAKIVLANGGVTALQQLMQPIGKVLIQGCINGYLSIHLYISTENRNERRGICLRDRLDCDDRISDRGVPEVWRKESYNIKSYRVIH